MPLTPQQIRTYMDLLESYKNSNRFDEHMSRDMGLLVPRSNTIVIDAMKANAKTDGNLKIAKRLISEGPF
ncbi:hypothetical protein NLM31_12920 [Bradyrhizobium sp. CCGUVB4N]|uniref:hypothetical protein n=1 Tax=Bradyrhizobium sp. CCGUVB4N TaxID=2949631 RepID=UPI0020B45963|nr:hypothetical protein [Bradyrhizobium sp. CCGUVB4N]MCP3381242.1 hypothetical protein [Bradyrhizobium sp. CCGUVB4N]